MTDEENKAIHMLQSYAGMTHKLTDNQGRPKLDQAIDTVLNLIEKQSKEIEELKYRKEESNIKLTKEQKENAIKYLRNYKDSLNEKAFKEKNIYVFEQLIQHVSNIIDIIYRLED